MRFAGKEIPAQLVVAETDSNNNDRPVSKSIPYDKSHIFQVSPGKPEILADAQSLQPVIDEEGDNDHDDDQVRQTSHEEQIEGE